MIEDDARFGANYLPFAPAPAEYFTLAVRSDCDPRLLTAAIRGIVAGIDPELPLFGIRQWISGRPMRW